MRRMAGMSEPVRPRRRARLRAVAVAAAVALLCGAAGHDPETPAAASAQGPEPYAVVVHPETRLARVSRAQLGRIFRGEQQFWPGGARVVLLVQSQGSATRAVVLRQVYAMDEEEFKRFWIAKTFRDDVASGPKLVSGDALARRITAGVPGAISVIPASAVDGSVKVLRIDGRAPGDPGYPLMGASPDVAPR